MGLRVFQFVDAIYDGLAKRLAENMTCNIETVLQNKAAKELSELSDQQLRQRGLVRDKLQHGSKAYPWIAPYSQFSRSELEQSLLPLMIGREHKPKDKIILKA